MKRIRISHTFPTSTQKILPVTGSTRSFSTECSSLENIISSLEWKQMESMQNVLQQNYINPCISLKLAINWHYINDLSSGSEEEEFNPTDLENPFVSEILILAMTSRRISLYTSA